MDAIDFPNEDLWTRTVRTIQMLAVDAVEAARSGHPGAPMGMAEAALVLWARHLRFDPTRPDWVDRDRFVLSAGHASMLQYALLHLVGFDLPLEEIRRFRQWGSRATGHPERGVCPGVETTTGPLGQGFANGVGMALAGRMLAARVQSGGEFPVGYRVFVLAGDGDLMEGISYEAASLAGHLRLGNLVCLYDSNRVTIEGATDLALSEDIRRRFESQGWFVQEVDGHSAEEVDLGLQAACGQEDRPSLIVLRTVIGRGAATLEGSPKTHGAPLGPREVEATRERLGWPRDRMFFVPGDVAEFGRSIGHRGTRLREEWEVRFATWRREHPEEARRWDEFHRTGIPLGLADRIVTEVGPLAGKATRDQCHRALQVVAREVPALVGGSADLAPSNKTRIEGAGDVSASDRSGRNLHFGIREHAMGAIVNGMALAGPFRPFGSTFLVFSNYLVPALRLAALMRLPVVFIFSHDSYQVGEDGPTHQPVEHLWALRGIPGMKVHRPADPLEVAVAWEQALEGGPTCIVTTRQEVPALSRPEGVGLDAIRRGGYVLREAPGGRPDLVLLATGSEVSLAIQAADRLEAMEGLAVRVASIPCLERFEVQADAWKKAVCPDDVPRVALEAGSTMGWWKWVGSDGLPIGLDRYGDSAPAEVLAREYGFTPEAIARRVADWWRSRKGMPSSGDQ
ncbi:MAG TPA: transketolase [Myxococcota bacterium]|nr:transketolase [Myxococcota bacterium]HQK50292.1 transketolase [Myxococcota bacterium]